MPVRGYTRSTFLVTALPISQLPRFKKLVAFRTSEKPPLVAVVFLFRGYIYKINRVKDWALQYFSYYPAMGSLINLRNFH